MNYLELCQAVVREGAITPGDGKPSSVIDQTGRMRLVVDWVDRANREIQSERNDFSFRVRQVDFQVDTDSGMVRMIDSHDDIESLNELTVSIRNAGGSQPLIPVPWQSYRYDRNKTLATTNGLPTHFSTDQAGDIHLIPKPTEACILRAEVKLAPQKLTADTDISYIPEPYHDAILYKALTYFYAYDESWDQEAKHERKYQMVFNKLLSNTTTLSDWNYTQSGESTMVMTCG